MEDAIPGERDAVAENVSLICCCTVVAPVSVIFGAMAFFFSLT